MLFTEEIWVPGEDLFIHIKYHALVLLILFKTICIFFFEKTICADRYITGIFLYLEEQVYIERPQITGDVHDQFVEDVSLFTKSLIILLKLSDKFEEASELDPGKTSAIINLE